MNKILAHSMIVMMAGGGVNIRSGNRGHPVRSHAIPVPALISSGTRSAEDE
jgi:hypothetical protein